MWPFFYMWPKRFGIEEVKITFSVLFSFTLAIYYIFAISKKCFRNNLLTSPGGGCLPFNLPLPTFSGPASTVTPTSTVGSPMDLDMMRFRSSVAAAGVLRNTITDHNTQAPPGMHRNLWRKQGLSWKVPVEYFYLFADSRRSSGKKPFACDICSKSFGHEISLTQHR